MWERTKRLINSYLDDMIEKRSNPDADVRAVTRGEIARLNEYEVQSRASKKLFEKELAEVNLKILGLAEREKIMRAQGDDATAQKAAAAIQTLAAQRDLLQRQIIEADAAAEKARLLREERKVQGTDLANEIYLTEMRETIASTQSGFDVNDPASTIDEMRSRLQSRSSFSELDAQLAQADREMETSNRKSQVDDLLAHYKTNLTDPPIETRLPKPPASDTAQTTSGIRVIDEEGKEEEKTLGRSDGNIRPID
jgi:phage shock protein A